MILSPRVLEAKVLSLLQRLNTTAKKTRDDSEAGQALLLQSAYPLKERLDRLELVRRQGVLFPSIVNRGTRPRRNGERRNQIGGIEPVSAPIPHRINQVIVKEFAFKTLAKLNPAAAKNIGVFTTGLRL